MHKVIAAVAALGVALTASTTAQARQDQEDVGEEVTLTQSDDVRVVTPDRIKGETEGYWIVTLDDAPLATYAGGLDGLAATSPEATGADRVDADGADAIEYVTYLEAQQASLVEALTARLGRTLDVPFRYTNALNGLTVWMTPEEASIALRTPGVADVERSRRTELTTDLGPEFIGAPRIWDGSATGVATTGEGVIVGIIDSGINPSNAAFAATDSEGFTHTNPYGDGVYVGACDPANTEQFQADFECNAKLLGAYDFFADDDDNDGDGVPVKNSFDHDGHGSHTASTTAGNITTGVGPAGETISGVAPRANVIAYRTCGDETLGQGYCTTAGAVAAVDQAIADGVSVLNYSIGSSSPSDPWTSADDLAFLNARAAGIFVSISAGNDGPASETAGSPSPPWAALVAALTHDRPSINQLVGMTGGSSAAPPDLTGRSLTTDEYTGVVVYAGDLPQYILDKGVENNALCAVGNPDDGIDESPWPAGTFEGEIVVCDRGEFARVEKSANAASAGAGGFIHADNGGGEAADAHVIPGIHIDQDEGQAVKDWVVAWDEASADPQPTATILPATEILADSTAGFSSRGPNRSTGGDTLVPTIGAPGVAIWASHGKYNENTYTYLSGTSMAAPHVAGSAALLAALHPDWTPAQIQSAMETTATTAATKEDGTTPADPFDIGAGRVRVDVAAQAGLVLDETQDDYLAADPAAGGDPTTINGSHLASSACLLECTFIRTVTGTAANAVEWTVTADFAGPVTITPDVFTLDPGADQEIRFDVDVTDLPRDAYAFGEITLTPSDASVPVAHLPMAIQPQTGDLPGQIDLVTRRDAGSDLVRDVTAVEITEFVASVDGLAKAAQRSEDLAEDPTNGEPYDTPDGTFTELVEVPEGASRAVFEIIASSAPDIDLYVGFDANGDGLASADEEVALSASGTAFEQVVLDDPAAGTWWALVQNWDGSGAETDAVTLAAAVLDGTDAGNARIEGPASQAPLDPFDLRVVWDLDDDPQEGDVYYGWVTLGTDPTAPDNIGTIPLTLTKLADDVSKTAAVAEADRGDTIDYTITVLPNVLSEDLAYTISDDLPDGITYVDGSATASSGDVSVTDGVLTWTGVMPTAFGTEGSYVAFTNVDQPEVCRIPFVPDGETYLDLAGFGIGPDPGVSGDGVVFTAFTTTVPPSPFYDDPTAGVNFTDDGFAFFDSTAGPIPFAPTPIGLPHWASDPPELLEPNDLMAPFWTDMEIFFDAAGGRGVSLANAGALSVIEFDDMEPWNPSVDPVPGAPTIDFEIVNTNVIDDSPGAWEIAFAYDNVPEAFPATGFPFDLVIGLENETGDAGTEVFAGLFADGLPVSDGLVICFDYERPQFDPVTITFQATVDATFLGGDIVNEAVSTVDNPGADAEVTSATVAVADLEPRAKIQLAHDLIDDHRSDDPVVNTVLGIAERELRKALRDRNWVDDSTLERRRGNRVYRSLERAAIWIQIADHWSEDDFSFWNDLLVHASRSVAQELADEKGPNLLSDFYMRLGDASTVPSIKIRLYGLAWRAIEYPPRFWG